MLTIRPMELRDIPELVGMEQDNFSRPWTEQHFKDLLERDYYIGLVDERDGRIAGFALLTVLGNEGDVDKVLVHADFRKQGVASLLLEALLDAGRRRGVEGFTLEVRVSNTPAINLYTKYGFVTEGTRPRFYDRPTEDALIMWLRQ